MKNKHPNQSLLPVESEVMNLGFDYLKEIDFCPLLEDDRLKNLYGSIRINLLGTLNTYQKRDLLFCAVIERIARTSIFLDKMERVFIKSQAPITSFSKDSARSDYILMQQEHRKCLEFFASIKGLDHKRGKVKVLEELRRTVSES